MDAAKASAGNKRKRSTLKFYAVRVGRKPGIYNSWEECRAQIDKFGGAVYKSFPSLTDAEGFVAGESGKGSVNKFYAVKSGKVPGIYTDWPSAQAQIMGWPKPRHKLFATRAEAQRFLDDEPDTKRAKTEVVETGDLHNPAVLTEDNFDPTVVLDPASGKIVKKTPIQATATKLRASGPSSKSVIRVHTDGSTLGNGRKGAVGGIGVYFGPNDQRNISEPLSGTRQTNQRAELTAILRTLEALPRDRDTEIITDSQYSIKCLTDWCGKWIQNGWKTSTGRAVENKDLVESILQRVEQREKEGGKTRYTWVKGHEANEGNNAADKLAVAGANKAKEQVLSG